MQWIAAEWFCFLVYSDGAKNKKDMHEPFPFAEVLGTACEVIKIGRLSSFLDILVLEQGANKQSPARRACIGLCFDSSATAGDARASKRFVGKEWRGVCQHS